MKDLRKLLDEDTNLVLFRCEDEWFKCSECDFRHFDRALNHTPDLDYDIMFIKTIDGKILYDRNAPINEYEVELI